MLAMRPFRRVVLAGLATLACAGLLALRPAHALSADGALRVVGDENYPPYLFLDAQGRAEGFLVDLWKLWERKTGVRVELRALKWDEAQRTLLRGDADVIETIFQTPQRAPLYDFTTPYAELPVAIYRDVSMGGITGLDALRGFRVGVMEGDACIEKLAASGIRTLAYYGNYTKLIQGAIDQEVKVFCLDEHPADFYLYRLDAHRRFVKAFELYRGEFHRAVRKGDQATLRLVEKGMAAISDEEMRALRDKWLRAPADYGRYALSAAWALAGLLVGAALLAAWVVTLKRTVAARTAEARHTAETLRDRQEQLAALGDNLPGGFVFQYEVIDGLPRFRYVSAGIGSLLGFTPAQITGDARPLFAMIPPDALATYRETESRSTREGIDFAMTIPFDLPDGRRRWLQVQSRRRPLPDGTAVWDGVALDVTERIEAESRLERRVDERTAELRIATEAASSTSERLRAIFDAATVGIMMIRDRGIEQCNRRLEAMTGYGRGELDGQSTRVLYADPEAWAAAGSEIPQSVSFGKPYVREQLACRKNGSTFWIRLSCSAVDPADLSRGIVGVVEDITRERAALEEMARARALAEDAARTKSEFLANMSHEIRTPMNSVIGMTLLALRADPEPRVRDYLLKIRASSEHLLGVINDILDFSRLESDRMALERVDFELDRVLDEVRVLFAEKAAEKGLGLAIERSPNLPAFLRGDPLRLKQVLINLVGNAIKFTERGEVRVRVTAQRRDEESVLVRFDVRDTGVGISDAQRARLFQSFRQADASTTRRFGGSGLGLAISKRLVELMGGGIGVDSVPDAGSTFWFTARLGVAPSQAPGAATRTDFRGMRALVVDDDAPAREVVTEMLRGFGLEAESVATGEAAVQAVASAERAGRAFDLLFVDWRMPGMDGVDTARELRRRTLARPPLVMMITAFDREDVLPAARQIGIGEVLVKPVSPSALFDAVNRCFGEPASAPADRGGTPLDRSSRLTGARALLVEDNPLNQQVAVEFLEAIGLRVDLAENGAVALDKVKQHPYDVVLMDMQMPVMDGLTATREIRKLAGLDALPILAMTANAMAGDRERCLAAGMNDHIAKPIDPEDLVAKLLRWVGADADGTARTAAAVVPAESVSARATTPASAVAQGTAAAQAQAAQAQARAQATAPAMDAEPSAALRAIDGLDTETGLRQSAGRGALYLSLLRKYVDGQRDAIERIGAAIAAAAPADAELAAHTLKGVSAQVGATQVRAAAERLEHALRSRSDPATLRTLLSQTGSALAPLLASIEDALRSTGEPKTTGRAPDPRAWPRLRDRLAALLADDDATVVDVVAENRETLADALGPQYAPFAEAVRDFDLPRALDLLRASA